jgi:cobalt/nickel transport system permease protein
MTLALDPFPCPNSPLSRLDPRWKLAALTLAAAAVAFLHTLPAAALALAGAVTLLLLARLPPRWWVRRLGLVALLLGPFALTCPFLVLGPGPTWHLGPVALSLYGLGVGLLLLGKGLAIVALLLVLLATAPLDVTLKAAHALRVPGLVVQLVLLTYRYIFVVGQELVRLRVALRARGYRNRARRHSYRTIGNVAGALLVRSYERAERVGQAMRCRGFDGRFRALVDFHRTTSADLLGFVLIAGGAAGLLLWEWFPTALVHV